MQPGKQLPGEALGTRTPGKGAGSKAQSATSLSDLVLEAEEGGVRSMKIALGPYGLCSMGFILWKEMDSFLCRVPSLIISVTIYF